MKDIVPELKNKVLSDFSSLVESDIKIQKVISGEVQNTSFAEVSKYAKRLGEYACKSLRENFTDETLPDGVLYWNIAKRIIVPLMQEVQKTAIDMAESVQSYSDEKNKIGLKAIRPTFNEERIEAVINKAVFLSKVPEVDEIGS